MDEESEDYPLEMYEMLQEEQKVTFSYDALRKFIAKHFSTPVAFGGHEHPPQTRDKLWIMWQTSQEEGTF